MALPLGDRARRHRWALFFCLIGLLVGGCGAATLLEDGRERLEHVARDNGFVSQFVEAGGFILKTAFRRHVANPTHLAVYIESDGRAFLRRDQPSPDPTPARPMVLELAAADPADAVLYLARPCQYATSATTRGCNVRYWTSHRYAEEVVIALNAAIDRYKAQSNAPAVELIGYSGGGAAAALIAARRTDVIGLTTIAANLDLEVWTRRQGLGPLFGSLNPADVAPRLGGVPQVHLVGSDDDVVPRYVTDAFAARLPDGAPARVVEVAGADHFCCWIDKWPELRTRYRLVP